MRKPHHWSGWPGAYCLHCGSPDPVEMAIADSNGQEDGSVGSVSFESSCPGPFGKEAEYTAGEGCPQCHPEVEKEVL